jgi:hypothetical protein
MQLKDYRAATQAFEQGSRLPDAHPFMKVLAAQMAVHAGDSQMARALWLTTYNSSHDPEIRANAEAHLRALQSDDNVATLEALVSKYREKIGRLPTSLGDLNAAGLMQGTPADPLGQPYKLQADGRVLLTNPDQLPFVEKGLPPGHERPKKPLASPLKP